MANVYGIFIFLQAAHLVVLEASIASIPSDLTNKQLSPDGFELVMTTSTPILSGDEEIDEPRAGERRFTLHPSALPWLEALQACWRAGEQLAVARSRADAVLLAHLLIASAPNVTHTSMLDAMHVGVHDLTKDGKWRTLEGALLSEAGYDLWMEGASGSCGALLADGRYVRQPCATALAYVCEAPPSAARAAANYTDIRGVGRFRLYEQPLPWALAMRRCEAEGAALAVPASPREAGLLAGVLFTRAADERVRQHGFFVGITDLAQEGQWRAISGQTLTEAGYSSWGPNEPSGGREQNCGALLEDGLYADYPCLVPKAYCCQMRGTPSDGQRALVNGRFRLSLDARPWLDSLRACHRQNATLAVPDTKEEEAAIRALMTEARSKMSTFGEFVHVGLHDIEQSGSWRTLAGDPAWHSRHSYSHQYARVNRIGGGGFCGRLRYDGVYGDQPCKNKLPYVCETSTRPA